MRRGFTLLELLIVLAVTGILLAIAIPSYRQYVARSHRADAIRSILATAACLERSRARSGYYDNAACANAASSDFYRLRIAPPAQTRAAEYRVIAEPVQPGYNDRCGNLALDQAGTRSISGPDSELTSCWGGR